MSTFKLSAYEARKTDFGSVQIVFNIGRQKPDPHPSRVVEATKLQDVVSAFDAYKSECEATGAPIAVSVMLLSGRKPNGFDAAFKTYAFVNVHSGR